ncbi:MAG: DNA primase [Acidaminococcaceae bacterium]|nr:DNA primase [Acidaminococcaceae bacterium]
MDQKYEDFKRQVRDSSDIVDVISGYITLQKKGRYYWACCPFHGEKTPSFSVDKERQFFYCYGCHTGGDVFSFVQKIENCTFPEAVKTLAGRANIPIPETHRTAADIRREKKRQDMYTVNDLACRYFAACLHKTEHGARALEYFHNRGITDEIIRQFSLGYSLPGFHSLQFNLIKKGCTMDQLKSAGLVRDKNGRCTDMFMNRVMIPIKDPRGKVIAFGGRVMDDGLPKYLNTGETDIFLKRETLFGMDVAIKAIREAKEAVVVEGYMDAISLHAVGITRVVASLGTAFSEQHAKLLHRITDTVVFAYDSDDAGRRNAVRAVGIAKKEGMTVKVLNVPEGKDPDEYVRHFGRDAFEELIKNAWDGTEFQIRYTISKNNITDLAGKVRCVSNIIPYLQECKTEIEAAGYIKFLAQQLVIDEGLIMGEYRKRTANRSMKQNPIAVPDVRVADSVPNAVKQAESKLLLLFFQYPGMIMDCRDILNEVGFVSPVRQSIYEKISNMENETFSGIQERLFAEGDGEINSEIARILSGENLASAEEERVKIADDCIRLMHRNFLLREFEDHRRLADTYASMNDARYVEELKICNELRGKITNLYGS